MANIYKYERNTAGKSTTQDGDRDDEDAVNDVGGDHWDDDHDEVWDKSWIFWLDWTPIIFYF